MATEYPTLPSHGPHFAAMILQDHLLVHSLEKTVLGTAYLVIGSSREQAARSTPSQAESPDECHDGPATTLSSDFYLPDHYQKLKHLAVLSYHHRHMQQIHPIRRAICHHDAVGIVHIDIRAQCPKTLAGASNISIRIPINLASRCSKPPLGLTPPARNISQHRR